MPYGTAHWFYTATDTWRGSLCSENRFLGFATLKTLSYQPYDYGSVRVELYKSKKIEEIDVKVLERALLRGSVKRSNIHSACPSIERLN